MDSRQPIPLTCAVGMFGEYNCLSNVKAAPADPLFATGLNLGGKLFMARNVSFDVIYRKYRRLSEKMEPTIDFRHKIQIFRRLTNLLGYMESLLSRPAPCHSCSALLDKPSRKTYFCRLGTTFCPAAKQISVQKRGSMPNFKFGEFTRIPAMTASKVSRMDHRQPIRLAEMVRESPNPFELNLVERP